MWMTENKGLTDRVHWPTEVFTWTKVSHQSSVSINFHSHYSGWCSYSFQLRWCAKFFAFYVGKWWSACEVDVILTQRQTSRLRPVVFCSLIYKLWFLISFLLKIPSLLSRPHFALHTFIFIFFYIHKIFLWPADDKC